MTAVVRNSLIVLASMGWAAFPHLAHANDSTAILKSGGLQLTTSPHITLEREDLFLSTKQVRVRYRFRNTSNADIVTLVAFPLPKIVVGGDVDYGVQTDDPVNFISFKVQVNGQPVMPSLQLRATRFGVDQTALLNSHAIPVLPFGSDFYPRLEKITGPSRKNFEEAGLIDWSSSFGANNVPLPSPHWRAQAVYYWKQTFKAGVVTQVTHSYRPVPGVGFFSSELLKNKEMQQTYCMDRGFRSLAAKRFSKAPGGFASELHYVLTTAQNWLGSIGEFHLTIDKGNPNNLLSLCINGIKKTGPATFVVRKKDFIPEHDLKILILEPGK